MSTESLLDWVIYKLDSRRVRKVSRLVGYLDTRDEIITPELVYIDEERRYVETHGVRYALHGRGEELFIDEDTLRAIKERIHAKDAVRHWPSESLL